MEQQPYLRYSDGIETRQEDENETEQEISNMYARLNSEFYREYQNKKEAGSDGNIILKAELRINNNLPDHLSQGLFRQGGVYPSIVRFSTSPGDVFPDIVSSLQGLAIKVLGVKGDKVLSDKKTDETQDFILVNLPVMPKGIMETYEEEKKRYEKEMSDPAAMLKAMTAVSANIHKILSKLQHKTQVIEECQLNILGETFFSIAALRYGDYIAKIIVKPLSANVTSFTGKQLNVTEQSTVQGQLQDFFTTNNVEYEVYVQLCCDTDAMPVEDISVMWPEAISPYQSVAKIVIPAQNIHSPLRKQYADNKLAFNPWHCLEEHRPLGNLMRLRRHAYEEAIKFRRNINVSLKAEPVSIAELPD